ncbi:hypothetical protein HN011_009708 [Eciton burchellii]|nr:hypothetical protein HN011_009708 [Eciton burchellii]
MNLPVSAAIFCILLAALLPETTYARPPGWILSRNRRQSDQALAAWQTKLALDKAEGIVVPVGLGKVDPHTVGRRRRSIPEGDLADPRDLSVMYFYCLIADPDSAPSRCAQIPLLRKEDPRDKQRGYQLI